MKRPRPSTVALLVALPVVVVGSFVIGRLVAPEVGFAGSDTLATQVASETGYQAWAAPLFAPGSAEIESGLFALFAAIGAGVLGFVVGRLWERRHRDASAAAGTSLADSETDPAAVGADSVDPDQARVAARRTTGDLGPDARPGAPDPKGRR